MDLSPLIKALEAHTAALIAHTKALAEEVVTDVEGAVKRGRGRPPKDAAQTQTAGAATAQTASQVSSNTASAATPATTNAAAASTAALEPSAPQATLKQVADAIVAVCEKVEGGRDLIKPILTKYGASKVPELKPADFGKVLAEVTAILNPPAAAQSATSGLF